MALFLPSPLPIGALGGLACKDARRRHPPGGTGALGFCGRRLHASSATASRPSPLPGRVIDAARVEVPAERPPLSSASFVAVPERTTRRQVCPTAIYSLLLAREPQSGSRLASCDTDEAVLTSRAGAQL